MHEIDLTGQGMDSGAVGSPVVFPLPENIEYEISFTPTDATSTGVDELTYFVHTGANQTGQLLATGTATSGVLETVFITDDYFVYGENTRYLTLEDPAGNIDTSSFTITASFFNIIHVNTLGDLAEVAEPILSVTEAVVDVPGIESSSEFGTHYVLFADTDYIIPSGMVSTSQVGFPVIENTLSFLYPASIDDDVSFGIPHVRDKTSYITVPEILPVTALGDGRVSFYIQDMAVESISDTYAAPSSISIRVGMPKTAPLIDEYLLGKHGAVEYNFGLRYYDEAGEYRGVLDNTLLNMSIKWDSSAVLKREVSFEINSQCAQIPFARFVEPYAILFYRDALTQIEKQEMFLLGTYEITNRKTVVEESLTRLLFTAQDRTLWLTQATIEEPLVVPAGGNYGTTIRQLAIQHGFLDSEISLPPTSINVPAPVTFDTGTNYYQIISQLADAVNWTQPFMTNNNQLRCMERRDMTERIPNVTYATDNNSVVLPDVQIERDEERVYNQIQIVVNDPLRDPFTETYNNNSATNPYSRSLTGKTVTKKIEDLNYLASPEIAQQRGLLEAQIESSTTRIELRTWPDFRRAPHEIYTLVVTCPTTGEVLIQDIWECTSWTLQASTGAEMTHQLRSILPV